MVDSLLNHLMQGLAAIQSPNSIFYWPYLVGSYALTIFALIFFKKIKFSEIFPTLFPKKIWRTKSTLTDLVITILYMLFFNVPTTALQIWISTKAYYFLQNDVLNNSTFLYSQTLPPLFEGLIVGLVIILAFDLATYIGHRLMHEIPFLWDIHVVHHSPEQLNLFSAYRQNPLDRVVRNSLGAVFTGGSVALVHWFLPAQTQGVMIMGAGFAFFFFMLTVHLQHSHIPIHYPKWLGRWVLSPHLHQIHHSSHLRHHDKNYGGIFPYWDKMFGTYCDEQLEFETLKFGVDVDPIKHSIIRCYTHPLSQWAKRIFRPGLKLD